MLYAGGYEKDSQDEQALGHSKGGFTSRFMSWSMLWAIRLNSILRHVRDMRVRKPFRSFTVCKTALASVSLIIADKGYESSALIT